jgi:hypothetical protein
MVELLPAFRRKFLLLLTPHQVKSCKFKYIGAIFLPVAFCGSETRSLSSRGGECFESRIKRRIFGTKRGKITED